MGKAHAKRVLEHEKFNEEMQKAIAYKKGESVVQRRVLGTDYEKQPEKSTVRLERVRIERYSEEMEAFRNKVKEDLSNAQTKQCDERQLSRWESTNDKQVDKS